VIGPDIYKKFMGKIQIQEQIKRSLIPRKVVGKKIMDVADPLEPYFAIKKKEMTDSISDHLRDMKRVTEVFDHFKPVMNGALKQKVFEFIKRYKAQPKLDADALARINKKNKKNHIDNDDFLDIINDVREYQRLAR
jgi:hypothetical protein